MSQRVFTRVLSLAVLVSIALALAGCAQPTASPAPETQPPEQPAATEAPAPVEAPPSPEDIEGTLVLYTAANEQMEALLIEGFNSRYPTLTSSV